MIKFKEKLTNFFKQVPVYLLIILTLLIFLIISLGIIIEVFGISDKKSILGLYGSLIGSKFYYFFGFSGLFISLYFIKKSLDYFYKKNNKDLLKRFFFIFLLSLSSGGLIFLFRKYIAFFDNHEFIGLIPYKISSYLVTDVSGSIGTTFFYVFILIFSLKQLNEDIFKILKNIIFRITRLKVKEKVKEKNLGINDQITINIDKDNQKTSENKILDEKLTDLTELKDNDVKKKYMDFTLPGLNLLEDPKEPKIPYDKNIAIEKAKGIEDKLSNFGINGKITEIKPGPVITMYEYKPEAGTKINKIASLSDDLAMALKATRVRIIAPIPGKDVVGIEVPNDNRETVYLKELLSKEIFMKDNSPIFLSLGKDISGTPKFMDLKKAPHLMIAGTTGSGKSVFLHSIITSMLFRSTPQDLRFIMIDPKMLELSGYEDIPHLLHPVVTDPKKSAAALKWAVKEMETRYKLLSDIGVRDIDSYNEKIQKNPDHNPSTDILPYIVIIIDELADLMFVAPGEIKESITRLSQMARAAGIHLIVASQRPSADVVAGLIKANFPARISFAVSSKTDSRIILDSSGAEELLGKGDMLLLQPPNNLIRIQGSIISDLERENISSHLKDQSPPDYNNEITKIPEESMDNNDININKDPLYDQALEIVIQTKQASISMVQRRLKIGYNRAANIIEMMEREGIVSEQESAGKPRKVNI
ncbi:DNA translocase FtsK 4TM domain-containing protein [bacterium]|nr:DNA translocase FtsK 4TM domain-containing protein [bacterium]